MAWPPLPWSCGKATSAAWRIDSYHQTLCRLSHTFLRYRPFRLSTLDPRLPQEGGEFQIRLASHFESTLIVGKLMSHDLMAPAHSPRSSPNLLNWWVVLSLRSNVSPPAPLVIGYAKSRVEARPQGCGW